MRVPQIERIVVNGKIATMERSNHFVEAFAISGSKVIAHGSNQEIKELAPFAERIDCGGRTVLPGFIDSHCHPDMHGARLGRWSDLSSGFGSKGDVLAHVRAMLDGKPADHWFVGFRYDDTRLGGYPTRDELDQAAGGRPAFLYRRDAHLGFANSAALAAAGFTRESVDPPFGRLDRDPRTGELTGLLRETAAHEIVNLCQRGFTPDDFAGGLVRVFDDFASYGITSVHNSLCSTQGIVAYQKMRENNELRMRVGLLASGREDELIDAIIRSGWRTGFGDEWIRLTGVEWCPDCSTSGRTAAYYEPYIGEKVLGEPEDNRGMLLYELEDFKQRVLRAHKAGLLVGADGVGDRGIDFVLDAFEHALQHHPVHDHRLRVEHCCNVTPAILERLKKLRVICSSATGFAYDLGDAYRRNRGAAAMRYMWPHRSMIDAGVKAPGHSDCPVCHPNPFRGIYSMVNRKTDSGADLDRREAVSVYEAVEAYTTLGAYCGKEEHIKGDLGVGKLADFSILHEDVFSVDPETLADVRVDETYLGGDRIFSRQS